MGRMIVAALVLAWLHGGAGHLAAPLPIPSARGPGFGGFVADLVGGVAGVDAAAWPAPSYGDGVTPGRIVRAGW